ncbi:MAG: nucleoside deaminase [Alcanivoracaceae bacterium]|nr:nucleoside deaminase [Alcanivoracaceae bacterium]
MSHQQVTLHQPVWLESWLHHRPAATDDSQRLREVLAMAEENVVRETGGPFAAAVYDQLSGERLSAAVNTVVRNCTALAHAETMALGLAQQRLQHFSLDYAGGPEVLLVTSSAPCTMCLGAIAWSGVRRVLFSTTRAEVEAIGFDEGPATPRWRSELKKRGIDVSGPRLRRQGQAVLAAYQAHQGAVYNGPAEGR